MIEKIIHVTVPRNISTDQAEVIERARELHPTWQIKVWQDPIHEDGFLLNHYWPKANSGAQLADLVRLDVLYKFGGVYVDSDLRLLKPLDSLVESFDFFIASEDGRSLTNALIGARKENQIIRVLIDLLRSHEPDWSLPPNVTTGPEFFSQHLKWKAEVTVLPRDSFYPYNWNHIGARTIHRCSYGEHLWSGSWRYDAHAQPKHDVTPTRASSLPRNIRQCVKNIIIRGFNVWHRFLALNPNRSKPQIKSYLCFGELVVQTIHGFNIVADGTDLSVTPGLSFNGYYELPEEMFLRSVVRGGDWVIDVGANIGSLCLLAAQRVGPFGRVFAYEPNPRPAQLMAKSLVMNWMHERVIQRAAAVSDERGTAVLSVLGNNLGGAQMDANRVTEATFSMTAKVLGPERISNLKVPRVLIDDEFPVDLPIKVLKIDVEGFEGRVLAGAKRLLMRRCVDFIIIELVPEVAGSLWNENLEQVQTVLEYGYEIHTLLNDGSLQKHADLPAAIRTKRRNVVLGVKN